MDTENTDTRDITSSGSDGTLLQNVSESSPNHCQNHEQSENSALVEDLVHNTSTMENEEPEPQLAQNDKDETATLPKLRPKKAGKKGRLKRKKKERTSRLAAVNDSQDEADFTFMRKRRQDLTLGAKVKVLEMLDHEPRVAQGRIASVFRVSQSQVSRIMKNKEAIMAQWNQFATPERKRCRLGKAGALEQKLVDWYKEARKDDLPISGPILMEKAKSIGAEMGIEFKPTAGWLGRWKDRNGINLKVFKEKDGTPSITKVANHWRRYMFAKATKDISFQNIWVVDETVLCYNSVPDFMLPRMSGGNDRMSVILASNIAGTERKPAAVIGTAKFLEYLSLPMPYYYHPKAKITLDCFSLWLRDWDRELRLQKKKIVLLLNRAHHHPENLHLFNISITYFPVGTAKVLQPLQLGIITCFKSLYRHQQLKHIFSKLQASEVTGHSNMFNHNTVAPASHIEGVSPLDAIYMIYKAWKHVSPETIVKGAVKAGLSKDVDALKVCDTVGPPLGISQQDFEAFISADADPSVANEDEGKQVDAHSLTTGTPFHGYAYAVNAQGKTEQFNQQINQSVENMPSLPKVSEALFACQVIRRYLQHQGGRLFDEFSQLESAIQLDMIHEVRPELKNEVILDPLHDPNSVHSLYAHKQAESSKLEYLQKVQHALDQKSLQKGMKKPVQSSVVQSSDNNLLPRTQELRSGIITQPVEVQRHDLPVQEMHRQNVMREEIQHPIQRPDLMHQEMVRPDYRQDVPIDRTRNAVYEMRPVNMSTVYRPLHPGGRGNQNDSKDGTLSTVPTDLRTLPLSDPRMAGTTHHPGHANELPQNMRQPETRLDNPGLPYYTIHNPLHHYVQPK